MKPTRHVTLAEAKARREAREAGKIVASSTGAVMTGLEEEDRELMELMANERFMRNTRRLNSLLDRVLRVINEGGGVR